MTTRLVIIRYHKVIPLGLVFLLHLVCNQQDVIYMNFFGRTLVE